MMVRSSEAFPEAMSVLQANIIKQGFTISRVQRVDVGLSAKGYKTDKYRVVFFGKGDEIQTLSRFLMISSASVIIPSTNSLLTFKNCYICGRGQYNFSDL